MTKKKKGDNYPSLYEYFELGDRVKRIYHDKKGNDTEFKGIILAIEDNAIEIYWDTQDGKYRPDSMEIALTTCKLNEIFEGSDKYTPSKKYN